MSEKAYHGLAGDVVRAIGPHSEADPVALLIQFLVCAGNVIGSCPYYQVESDHHHANLFVALVGNTAKGRKGTSMGRICAIIKLADEQWHGDRTKGGLSSGEGLIHQVRDEVTRWKDGESHSNDCRSNTARMANSHLPGKSPQPRQSSGWPRRFLPGAFHRNLLPAEAQTLKQRGKA